MPRDCGQPEPVIEPGGFAEEPGNVRLVTSAPPPEDVGVDRDERRHSATDR